MNHRSAPCYLILITILSGFAFEALANGVTPRVRIESPNNALVFDCIDAGNESLRIANTQINGRSQIKIVNGPFSFDVDLEKVGSFTWHSPELRAADENTKVRIVLHNESIIDGEIISDDEEVGLRVSGELVESGVQVEFDLQACEVFQQYTGS